MDTEAPSGRLWKFYEYARLDRLFCESTEINFKNEMVRCSDFAPSLSVAKEALASNRNLKLLTSKFHMTRSR